MGRHLGHAGNVWHASATPEDWRHRWDSSVLTGDGCHVWDGAFDKHGYGTFLLSPFHRVSAHRFAYELHRGGIPADLVVDHLCANKWCVNPAHLEAVTRAENSRRGGRPHLAAI